MNRYNVAEDFAIEAQKLINDNQGNYEIVTEGGDQLTDVPFSRICPNAIISWEQVNDTEAGNYALISVKNDWSI